VVENGGGSCKGVRSLDLVGNLVELYSSVIVVGGEKYTSDVESCKSLVHSSSCRLISLSGRGILLVVDAEDTISCSHAVVERSDSSKEKLLV